MPEPLHPEEEPGSTNNRPATIAPLWHTAAVVFALLGASFAGFRGIHPAEGHSKIAQYLWTISWEWILTAFVCFGIRKRVRLRDFIGGKWDTAEAFLWDIGIAAFFWLFSASVLALLARIMRLDQEGRIDSMRRQLGFLVPGSSAELLVWFCLSLTAGICEEIIFRGYLQRQFAGVTGSMFAGVVLSAVVFGGAHGYEGGQRMVLIGVFGFLFGALAWWRKSLRPGMIAHAWHDALSGAVLRLLK